MNDERNGGNTKEKRTQDSSFESFTFDEPVCSAEFAEGCLFPSEDEEKPEKPDNH